MTKAADTTATPNLWVFLMGDVFEVHKVGCKTIPSRRRRNECKNEFPFSGTDEREIVLDLWDDHIAEGENADDPDAAYDEYAPYVHFHGACTELTKPAPRKPKAKAQTSPAKMTREQKQELATAVVRAAAEVLGDTVVMNGMDPAEAAKAISHWLHHLPTDRTAWPQSLPKPNRSDWR